MFKHNCIHHSIVFLLSVTFTTHLYADEIKINHAMVSHDIKHDVSLPLRYLEAKSYFPTTKNSMKHILAKEFSKNELTRFALIPLKGFQGLGVGFNDYQVTSEYPDIASSVGITQIVQWVNSDIAVFDKATGHIAAGFPKPGNAIWAGFGGACENSNVGLQTVKYDQLAGRWVLSQSAYDNINGPYYQCFAVSTSEDATGSYNRYAFQINAIIDYARLGLWPDAYYISLFLSGNQHGPLACALERDKMLTNQTASMHCLPLFPLFTAPVLPADLDGMKLPLSGNPEYFIGVQEPYNLLIAKFHVDFATPANTAVSLFSLPVAQFAKACSATNGVGCVMQPNTTNRLDVLSDRLNSNFPYRQYHDYGSMVAVHTVQGPAPHFAPALRWYELRLYPSNPNQNPVVYQQATFAPDSMNRFMGSIAIDRFTNIALGYSVTSSLIYPSLQLLYHNYNHQNNKMTLQPLVTGHGSQINNSQNFGRRSSMSVDPVDQCTFWYSNEYLKTDGSFNWSTFIVNFKLAACE